MSALVTDVGSYSNKTATGAVSICPTNLLGFYVNSTSSGVINFKDGGASGTAMCGSITPAIGFHRFPATAPAAAGLYFTLVSGTIDITIFHAPA